MRAGFCAQDGLDNVLERRGIGDGAVRQLNAEGGAQANHQFNSFKTTEAEVAFEVRLRAPRSQRFETAVGAQFEQELIDDFEGLRLRDG